MCRLVNLVIFNMIKLDKSSSQWLKTAREKAWSTSTLYDVIYIMTYIVSSYIYDWKLSAKKKAWWSTSTSMTTFSVSFSCYSEHPSLGNELVLRTASRRNCNMESSDVISLQQLCPKNVKSWKILSTFLRWKAKVGSKSMKKSFYGNLFHLEITSK